MAAAVREYLDTYPAVRVQHDPQRPVGKGLEAWQDNTGATWLRSLIVDDAAKKLVRKGVLKAYSVGIANPQTRQSQKARRWEIYGGRLAEVSLVDSPSNGRAGITVCKMVKGTPRYDGTTYRITKSGKLKITKPDLAKSAKAAVRENDPWLWFLNSGNPFDRESARSVLRG
jgi:phage head maturation protease